MMDIAAELGCGLINIWNGQDGYDYPFEADYLQEREWLVSGLRECAQHRADVRVSLEYKLKEPRNRSYLGTAAGTLLIAQEIGLPNVGVTIDVGHALVAYEDVGESIAMLSHAGSKLFHMHFNDNYRLWDDDMIVGSVHTIETWSCCTGLTGSVTTGTCRSTSTRTAKTRRRRSPKACCGSRRCGRLWTAWGTSASRRSFERATPRPHSAWCGRR